MTVIRLTTALLALIALSSCASDRSIAIGAKPFAEQQVLAQMLRLLSEDAGLDAEIEECRDSYDCQRKLREGEIDLMVEYTGTALQFVGGPVPDRDDPVGQVRGLFEPLGLRWLEPLGFDNGYRLLVPSSRSAARDLTSIADLNRIPGGVRLASPPEFLWRARDGLPALLRRYGLELNNEPLIVRDPTERFQAVRDGRADVAVGYSTDGAISGFGLTALSDPEGFFPPYRAAAVVREKVWSAHEPLHRRLDRLSGKISDNAMRDLNYSVQVEGQPADAVALRFLENQELLSDEEVARATKRRAPLIVGTHGQDGLGPETARALRALRHLFPERPVRRNAETNEPLYALEHGDVHFAVVGAERYFIDRPRRRRLRGHTEAVAVLGTSVIHLVRRDGAEGELLEGRIGVQPEGSHGGTIGEAILEHADATAETQAESAALLRALGSGDLDGAIIVANQGDAALSRALARGDLRLAPIGPWLTPSRAVELPYLQRARLPVETYDNQETPIDTLSVQIVLAGPRHHRTPTGSGGPAAALSSPAQPLTTEQLERLTEATGIVEIPDAVLPSAWTSSTDRRTNEEQGGVFGVALDTILNIFAIVFIVWLILAVRHGQPEGEFSP